MHRHAGKWVLIIMVILSLLLVVGACGGDDEADQSQQSSAVDEAGAAKLADSSSDTLTELRKKVTSPGGTTERALESFRLDDFNAIVKRALHACAARAAELESTMDNN